MRNIFIFFCFIIIFSSCKKTEGEGGQSIIKGRIIKREFVENSTNVIHEYPLGKEDIFIIYGSSDFYGDNQKSSYDGTFKFSYLRPGNYTIFVYSDDTTKTSSGAKIKIEKTVTIGKSDNTVDAGDLIIYKQVNIDEGSSSITGKVHKITYFDTNCSSIIPKDTAYAQEEDIYISYENNPSFFDRTRAGFDGTFMFKNLVKGNYKIFMYNDDLCGSSQKIPTILNVSITEDGKDIILNDVYIKKLD